MARDPITIDPAKITEKILSLQLEIKRLNALLDTMDSLIEFAADKALVHAVKQKKQKPGRPTKPNPAYAALADFVKGQHGQFDSNQAKEVASKFESSFVFDALEQLEQEGEIKTIQKAVGRRIGLYKKTAA